MVFLYFYICCCDVRNEEFSLRPWPSPVHWQRTIEDPIGDTVGRQVHPDPVPPSTRDDRHRLQLVATSDGGAVTSRREKRASASNRRSDGTRAAAASFPRRRGHRWHTHARRRSSIATTTAGQAERACTHTYMQLLLLLLLIGEKYRPKKKNECIPAQLLQYYSYGAIKRDGLELE